MMPHAAFQYSEKVFAIKEARGYKSLMAGGQTKRIFLCSVST